MSPRRCDVCCLTQPDTGKRDPAPGALASLVGVFVFLQAYVFPWMIPAGLYNGTSSVVVALDVAPPRSWAYLMDPGVLYFSR